METGVVNGFEVCDDGNTESGDECPADCFASCGDGVVHSPETCDDGNDVAGDGCTSCTAPGELAWSAAIDCPGDLASAPDGSLILVCTRFASADTPLVYRLNLDGSVIESWPYALIEDPAETEILPVAVAVESDGHVVIAMKVRRNITAEEPSRMRVARFTAAGAVDWTTDLTTYPSGPDEIPSDVFVTDSGRIAVAGFSRDSGPFDNRLVAYSLSSAGFVTWRYEHDTTSIGRVVAADASGLVYAGGVFGFDSAASEFTYALLVGISSDGTNAFTQVFDEPAGGELSGGGTVGDLAIRSDGVHVVGISFIQDDMVPASPRTTTTAWERDLSSSGMELAQMDLWTQELESTAWVDVAEQVPQIRILGASAMMPYVLTSDGALSLDSPSDPSWEVGRDTDLRTVWSHFQFGYLWCVSTQLASDASLDCYYIR